MTVDDDDVGKLRVRVRVREIDGRLPSTCFSIWLIHGEGEGEGALPHTYIYIQYDSAIYHNSPQSLTMK